MHQVAVHPNIDALAGRETQHYPPDKDGAGRIDEVFGVHGALTGNSREFIAR